MSIGAASAGWKSRADAALGTRAAGWTLLALVAVLYTWAYVVDPLNPGASAPAARQGWWSWADQTKYVEAAAMLADGRIDRGGYHYPLGYSVLGAPFVRLWPAHPFFLPNLALVLAGAALAWRLARRWLGPTATLALAAGFVATHSELLRLTLVVPWNTIAVQTAFFAGLWLTLTRRDARALGGLALLAAATYLVRPADAACFAPLLVGATLRLPTWRARLGGGALGVLVVAAAVVGVAWLNWRVFGDWKTPYERGSFENIGFLGYPVAHKLYGLFVDGETFFGEFGTALLWRYPWLFLAVPGAVWWVRRDGWSGAAALAAIGLNWGLYVCYNDFTPSALYRFSLIHYVAWAFWPLLVAGVAAMALGWRERVVQAGAVAAVALFVGAIGLKLKEVSVAAEVAPGVVRALPAERPLWVRFPGEKIGAVADLRLDGRALTESKDYQIPYVRADLRVMLGARAAGRTLDTRAGAELRATPVVGTFEWSWWPRWRRLWARPAE